jgi:hypothetical protein
VLCQVIQKISRKHWWFQCFPSKCTCCRYSICLSVYLSICLSVYLSLYLSIHTSIHRSIDLCKKNESQVLQKRNLGFVGHPPSRGTFPAASSSAAARRASMRIQCGRRFQIEKWDVVKSIINGIVLGLFTSINSML